jgi:Chaperone of endosialidase
MGTLISKPGISRVAVSSGVPKEWSQSWFRDFSSDYLKGADVRNAVGSNGITVTGNLTTPYASIGLSAPVILSGSPALTLIATAPDTGATLVLQGSTTIPSAAGIAFNNNGAAANAFIGLAAVAGNYVADAVVGDLVVSTNRNAVRIATNDGVSTAFEVTGNGNVAVGAPSTSLTVNTFSVSHAFDLFSATGIYGFYIYGMGGGQSSSDLAVSRSSSTANSLALGPNIQLFDTGGASALIFQLSGGQIEFWQYNGSWKQVLFFDSSQQLHLPQLSSGTGTALIETGDKVLINSSSRRYKLQIEDLEPEHNHVLKLRPRWYRANPKTSVDRPDWSFYGLIAEEVYEIDPRLVNLDKEGKPKSVAYDRLAVLLIPLVKQLSDRVAALEKVRQI